MNPKFSGWNRIIKFMEKKLGIAIIISGFILLILIVYFIFFHNFGPDENILPSVQAPVAVKEKIIIEPTSDKVLPEKTTEQKNNVQSVSKEDQGKIVVQRLASSFAERYGSFSNQSDYGNIRDLEIFMSEQFRIASENNVNEMRAKKTDYVKYSGVTAKSLSTEIKSFTVNGQTEALVHTRKRETTVDSKNEITYAQDLLLKLVFENGSWKVDSAEWQNKSN